jgi:hypothetical protein
MDCELTSHRLPAGVVARNYPVPKRLLFISAGPGPLIITMPITPTSANSQRRADKLARPESCGGDRSKAWAHVKDIARRS